jgi:signal transduction histidine kinase
MATSPAVLSNAADTHRADAVAAGATPYTEALVLPLLARGQVHGTLVLAMCGSGRHFDASQLALASDVGSRAGLAVDNCLLFKEIRDNDRRKDEFLATLSHELRNPLAPMRTAIHAMHLAGAWPAEGQKVRAMLERQLDHLTRLVDDLLDVSRITRGKIQLRREPVDLVQKLTYALDNCRAQVDAAKHTLDVSLPAGPVVVDGDRVRLQQIFENLIVNACRYTEPGGTIAARLAVDETSARVTIRDTGVGISPQMLPRIFDMFAQADVSNDRTRHGLGIGLALVRNLVQLHGGSVSAASEGLGQGSEFTVTLPVLAGVQPAADTAYAHDVAPDAGSLRILVVDDNADAAESLSVLLGLLGHRVEVAHDGTAAVQSAAQLSPDLVFLDIGLPGMDGYQVAEALRAHAGLGQGRFIALSGYGTESDKRRSRDAGFVGHLVKPLNPRELPNIIAAAIALPR